ncbi:helix-turn-helix domain-containing protein [Roseobacter sp. MH60115]|uniref:helix-turn-helix domain-containing protein n=1 Tax=Roseobacter sp. MH60115 TaxID=2785324 RepID=UPI0018A2C5DA
MLRRRAEYARDLIVGTADPLAEITFTAGFSSQAHMTVVMRKIFRATPAAMRN